MRATVADLNHVIDLARADLLALKAARLFITGGTGYIGRWLLESLCYANRELGLNLNATVLSRDPMAFLCCYPHLGKDPAVTLLEGDVRNFRFPAGHFTHGVHAATDVIAANTPLDTFDVTSLGTRQMLDFCQQRGVEDVLLLSSGAVYGPIPHTLNLVPETYRGRPDLDSVNAAYGVGKLVTEWLGTAYSSQHGLSCKSARVFAQLGPFLALDKQFAAGNFIRNALRAEPFIIQGDGTPLRSYMYGADLAVWLLGILVRGQARRAYNVGSDHAISIGELALQTAQAAGIRSPEIIVLTKPTSDRYIERYVPDISRAGKELGLEIRIPLDDALARTLTWYRQFIN